MNISRREFLRLANTCGLFIITPKIFTKANAQSVASPWTSTGNEVPELAGFDDAMRNFMQSRNISGGALAITQNNKLVLARGYTYNEDNEDIVVQPTSLFRIASISKPITATAILRLVQDNQLQLSTKLTDILTLTPRAEHLVPDPRLSDITVLNLLQHLGGWNRDTTFDPMFYDAPIASALGVSLPVSKLDIMTYMTGRSLQHSPGTTYSYSNYGYCLLGQIIEAVTGQSYQDYVRNTIFRPLNITRSVLGRTFITHRLANEVKYHAPWHLRGPTVFSNSGSDVPAPYGRWNLENMDAHGGWLASAVDMVRFASIFDSPVSSSILNQTSIDTMFGLPENIPPDSYLPGDWYYGCGWAVRDWGDGGRNTWHVGSLDGTYTLLVRRADGLTWCVLFNQRTDASGLPYSDIDGILHQTADAVSTWPNHDLFNQYFNDEGSLSETVYLPLVTK
jgi:CubicO group peptidase (beta-lactamase class C family)